MFHLTHYELESAIIDLMNSWSTGGTPRGPEHWPPLVAERRAALKEWAKHETPPALGPVPDVIDDPAIVMLWGITRESLDAWLQASSDTPSDEIKGFAASNGVVEGTARVVRSVEEIARRMSKAGVATPAKRPADRPYAETRGTDPDGNNFDISTQGFGSDEGAESKQKKTPVSA